MPDVFSARVRSFAVAAVLFFVSGGLGLGYQLVWIQKTTVIVGSSQIALSTVVASFFLGLAVGSLFVGRHWQSQRWSPLFVYGGFEAAIGIFALSFPQLFAGVESAYGALYPSFAGSAAALFALRFALLFALFLVPTFFMGGTLPLLLDGLVDRDRSVGSLTSLLYGLNIVGAVVGVLLTAYFAIPMLGLNGTSRLAGFGNLSVAAVALIAFRRARPLHALDPAARPPAMRPDFMAALSFVSGLAAIGYQIVWTRYFGLFNQADPYRIAILLAVFLAALSVGSTLLAGVLRAGIHPLRVTARVQACVPLLAAASLEWWHAAAYRIESTPDFGARASWTLAGEAADATFFAPLFQTALTIFAPVVLLGTGLPSIIAAATRSSRELRASAGSLVFWNTLGSSAGGFAAGYVLLPGVGLTGTLRVLALLSFGLAIGAEWKLARENAGSVVSSRGLAFAAIALSAALLLLRDDVTERAIRRFSISAEPLEHGLVLKRIVEGPLTTAYVTESLDSRYIVAGNVMLATVRGRIVSTQAIQGHLPPLWYPRPGAPERALGIALGSGQSFGALLRYPLQHLDVVDISPEMVELSLSNFAPFNHGLGSDERVDFHLDDGRHFVDRSPPNRYDVISMEPPPPTAAGIQPLYSLEFYQSADRALREDGVLMQWLPLYFVTPAELRGIIRTQAEVFPHTFVFMVGTLDFMVVSFKTAAEPQWKRQWIEERAAIFAGERLVSGNRWCAECAFELATFEGIAAALLTGPEDVAALDGPIYRDDDQRLSYSSGDRHLLRRYGGDVARMSFGALPLTPFRVLARYFAEPIPVDALERERARALAYYHAPTASEVSDAVERHRNARSPEARAETALSVARIHSDRFALDAALEWARISILADPAESRPEQLAAIAEVVGNLAGPYRSELVEWVRALPPAARVSMPVWAIRQRLGEVPD